MERLAAVLIVTLAAGAGGAAGAQDPAPARVRQSALARVAKARAMAADPELVRSVAAKNASGESMDEVHRKDRAWRESAQAPLRRALSGSACARRLRDLTQDDPLIAEAILMDHQGANVCVSHETSDYWQGDEPKFQRTYEAGRDIFVDEPALDASTGVYGIQLSVIVYSAKARAGALTLTLRVPKEAGAAAPR